MKMIAGAFSRASLNSRRIRAAPEEPERVLQLLAARAFGLLAQRADQRHALAHCCARRKLSRVLVHWCSPVFSLSRSSRSRLTSCSRWLSG